MTQKITTGGVHHITLTVSDVERSCDFYTTLLDFQRIGELGPRILLANGSFVLALTPPPDPAQAVNGDLFNENRIGLDHVSLSADSITTLEQASRLMDERDTPHGEIEDLGPELELYVMAFRDPDNIQLELTAPYET